MNKIVLLLAVVGSSLAFGQRALKNDVQINAGIGFGNKYGPTSFYAGVDYGIHQDITIGAEARIGSKNYYYFDERYKGNWFSIGANGNYHFNTLLKIPNKWDVYAGATVGFNSFNYDHPNSWDNNGWKSPNDNGVGVSVQAGGRYYFTNNFGVNIEVSEGSLHSGAKAGITYKF